MEIRTLGFREEHFALYRNYQANRHPGDSMDNPDPEKYQKFMTESGVDSFMMELRIGKRLLSVSVVDHVGNGLSAVYTFYDPSETRPCERRKAGRGGGSGQRERHREDGVAEPDHASELHDAIDHAVAPSPLAGARTAPSPAVATRSSHGSRW